MMHDVVGARPMGGNGDARPDSGAPEADGAEGHSAGRQASRGAGPTSATAGGATATELTVVRKAGGGILSKRVALDEDGKPRADGSGCRLTVGMAARHRMHGVRPARALADRLDALPSHAALALGRLDEAVEAEAHLVASKRRAGLGERHEDGL